MTILLLFLFSLWAGIYTSALALAYWRAGNRRGGVGVGLLALIVLVGPPTLQAFLSTF